MSVFLFPVCLGCSCCPDSGPGGGLDCGLAPVSAQQHDADGAGEGRDVDAEQSRHQVRRKFRSHRYSAMKVYYSVFLLELKLHDGTKIWEFGYFNIHWTY